MEKQSLLESFLEEIDIKLTDTIIPEYQIQKNIKFQSLTYTISLQQIEETNKNLGKLQFPQENINYQSQFDGKFIKNQKDNHNIKINNLEFVIPDFKRKNYNSKCKNITNLYRIRTKSELNNNKLIDNKHKQSQDIYHRLISRKSDRIGKDTQKISFSQTQKKVIKCRNKSQRLQQNTSMLQQYTQKHFPTSKIIHSKLIKKSKEQIEQQKLTPNLIFNQEIIQLNPKGKITQSQRKCSVKRDKLYQKSKLLTNQFKIKNISKNYQNNIQTQDFKINYYLSIQGQSFNERML